MKKGLLETYNINRLIIEDYFNSKLEIPIWIVEAACNINLNDIKIPTQYQYLWFCLHNTILRRKQPSGKEFKTKVNFSSCYVKLDEKLEKKLDEACKVVDLPKYKFVSLCGYKKLNIYLKKIPLKVILKVCQILKLDIWELIEDQDLFGKTNRNGKIKAPSNKRDVDLMVVLVWLRTEGHIELGSTHIEINQKNNIESLKTIKELLIRKFNLNDNLFFGVGKRGEDRLIISSSPLRQLLCLKYGFPLGYKSGSLQPMDLRRLSKDEYKKIMAAFIQTEGCLSYQYTRNKKKKLPKFEFIVKDRYLANDCLFTLRKLGFKPYFSDKQNIFKVGLFNSQQVIDLVHQTKKYFFDQRKIEYLKEVCTSGIGL